MESNGMRQNGSTTRRRADSHVQSSSDEQTSHEARYGRPPPAPHQQRQQHHQHQHQHQQQQQLHHQQQYQYQRAPPQREVEEEDDDDDNASPGTTNASCDCAAAGSRAALDGTHSPILSELQRLDRNVAQLKVEHSAQIEEISRLTTGLLDWIDQKHSSAGASASASPPAAAGAAARRS